MEIYDRIGIGYSDRRATDSRIAAQIYSHLTAATSVLNIGAGAGSYEPDHLPLVALEPSAEMIAQRTDTAPVVVQGVAEALPFADNSFTHVMTVLSMHHWRDREAAFAEIARVATDAFVALTWLPDAGAFWLTRDYFPEFYASDAKVFPGSQLFASFFDDVQSEPVLIPEDCIDGFLAAYWKRPAAYLDSQVRQSISSFANVDGSSDRFRRLRDDLDSGRWLKRNRELMNQTDLDAGYRIISGRIRKSGRVDM
ncbi:class I SAM-dependent methyltransferase [Halioglobus maricola]|uniref:Class I SAM-dependent methyltransferase n=1 Tax=Halioglobus maricola TaxID=2601894 RepID=A0A5P9NMG2_9GAMM|nr:class I SAM-dependent methyltransferase [Halioglobus maricola]QFU77053.1 class I SAM-dependent methyltransferase [Halioglobus maricola]